MKLKLIPIIVLAVILAASGCKKAEEPKEAPAAKATQGIVAETPGIPEKVMNWDIIPHVEDIIGTTLQFAEPDVPLTAGEQIFTLIMEKDGDHFIPKLIVNIAGKDTTVEVSAASAKYVGAYLAVGDVTGDGFSEALIVLKNGENSAFSTRVFTNSGTEVKEALFCTELPAKIENGVLTINNLVQDLLGTKKVSMRYSISGTYITPADKVYNVVDIADSVYEVIAEFKAYNEDGSERTIKVGEKLTITGTDLSSKAYFTAEDGTKGYFDYSFFSQPHTVDGKNQQLVFKLS